MSFFPILALCLLATVLADLAIALYGFVRSDLFWPLAFCASLGGLSVVFMLLVFLDFEATTAIGVALIVFAAAAALSLLPAIRSVA